MKQLALIAMCLALAVPAQARAADTLRDFSRQMLTQAPHDFAAMRGAEKKRESYQITYGLATRNAKSCRTCTIVNEFAWTNHAENWHLSDDWSVPTSWSPAKTASYVVAQVTPLLANYARKTTGSKDYPTYRWSNPSSKVWVQIDTYNGGFTTKIGHDLVTPAHRLHDATIDDMQTLRSAIANLVKLGTAAAANNFETLRGGGKSNEIGTMEYKLNLDLGSSLNDCTVSDNSQNVLKLDDFSPNWTLDCSTTPMVASIPALLTEVQQAVASAIPSSFSVTTGKLLGLDDYRWDDTSANVAVSVGSLTGYFLPTGLAEIRIGITHFTQ